MSENEENGGEITNREIFNLLKAVMQKNEDLQKQNQEIKEEIKQEIRNTNIKTTAEIEVIRQENTELREQIRILQNKVQTTERKLKKYNVIVYGLPEKGELIEDTKYLLKIVNEKLNLECQYTDLRDLYRIGNKSENGTRPISIEVINYQLKLDIIRNSKKLKGTGIFITNEYIQEDYIKRKVLYSNLQRARNNNYDAVIKNDELIVNGKKLTYEQLLNDPIIAEEETNKQEPETEQKETDQQRKNTIPSSGRSRESVTQDKHRKEKVEITEKTLNWVSAQEGSSGIKKERQPTLNTKPPQKRTTRLNK